MIEEKNCVIGKVKPNVVSSKRRTFFDSSDFSDGANDKKTDIISSLTGTDKALLKVFNKFVLLRYFTF